jgi:hypothetical protein
VLSRTSGQIGTRVRVDAFNCPHPLGQADRLGWQDHYYNVRTVNKDLQYDRWRVIPLVRTSGLTAQAVFTVSRSDHKGAGLLDMWCGGANRGNAVAYFTVTN